MLYGAYGSTGRLILDEALRRGHRPVLAGRDTAQLSALGQATGLPTVRLPLDDDAALRTALSRARCVLLAAGPYSVTGQPMRAACLDTGCSYLDINGEIEDFQAALGCDTHARRAGIAILPGVGYGVVFGECLAAQLARRMPDATWLRLSLATQTAAHSRGATLSEAAVMAAGGRDIHQGALRTRPMASCTWRTPPSDLPRMRFASAPLAELVAAHRSTGIPNVIAGIPLSRPAAALLRIAGPVLGASLTWAQHAPRTGPKLARRRRSSQGCARGCGLRPATPQVSASPPYSRPARAIALPRSPPCPRP
jgi:saccharopine dehydrogenase (NAD+, L-lysine-forming)